MVADVDANNHPVPGLLIPHDLVQHNENGSYTAGTFGWKVTTDKHITLYQGSGPIDGPIDTGSSDAKRTRRLYCTTATSYSDRKKLGASTPLQIQMDR